METTNRIVVLEVDCERCDGKGCEFCFGQPEAVRTRDGHRLCEHVVIARDMRGWMDIECDAPATHRLDFRCVYPDAPGPTMCAIHVCGDHRTDAVQDLIDEDSVLVCHVHRDHGFPVIGREPEWQEVGCPMCAVDLGWASADAWDATWGGPRRKDLPMRQIVREFTVFPADPTVAYELECGHVVI